ncbi:hypothetical protein C6362_11745 [Megasphaera elsdenii DSM 20460]|nr:hypothetical protein C6362_00010 [Megasphaera elsdenii DSM 20460]AVO75548.1 hypothetical protein C6362_00020 [Megasphaera elsdenii DSM 20460]AVO75549.1 hypothetical protein C6362_00030 [Megasphaera elsdenii DSM 20460]AVO75550.1 hypothetical protein C6362_00040 [Megasphaera elsdenii DSM 20460]AVO75655.1 hypothetical protein C6362_11735 [Megasphaera elsdenii DSM 20460]
MAIFLFVSSFLMVRPLLSMVVFPVVTLVRSVSFFAIWTFSLPSAVLWTAMFLSVRSPWAPPTMSSCSFSFFVMTLSSSPLNFRPSSRVATSCLVWLLSS